ncbi:MAG: serine/threonine-protein kinase, partial [Gemmatimonadaceae bacterium]
MRSPTREEWLRLEPYLDDAMALPLAEARALLVAPCDGDPELLAWVERFLAGVADDDFPVSLPSAIVAGAFADDSGATPDAEARFGAYRIVGALGRGGMGSVFLADRADGQFEQRVAIKVMHRGIGGRDGRERFLRERQILARLDHPNVAHLVDGGITTDGQPWFAMEHVDGAPFDTWCDARRASIEERLMLFLSVCDAVQFAHQKLVIHRDLKPSNILVTHDGQVKLLDFGIARLLQDSDAGVTQTGMRAFTPEYAAPEQWRGEPVSTGSDVYSLGVVLYELLAGVRPHRLQDAPETEWPRMVLQDPIVAPSLAATPQAAAARGTTVHRLRHRLRDDLETIALTALRAESARRYRTVDQLAADVRRHLAGHPIAARPDSWRYRSAKFVRRNRVGVVAASLVALSVLGGAAGIAWQARRVAREAARATAARQFLAGVFRESDPANARGDSLTAGEMLDRASKRLETDFRDQPEVKLDLLLTLGEIYRNLGRLPTADSLLTRATLLADSVDSDVRVARATSLVQLSAVRLAAGQLESADSLVRRGIAGLTSDTAIAAAYSVLGAIERRRYSFAAAESAYRRAISMSERAGANPLDQAAHWNDFGVLLLDIGRYREADSALRRAIALEEGLL